MRNLLLYSLRTDGFLSVDLLYTSTETESGIQNPYVFIHLKNLNMNPTRSFRVLLKRYGYSDKLIEELWKWYDPSERKGVASY